MPHGIIKETVHLSGQSLLKSARLIHDHNDTGYGLIDGEEEGDVYFACDAVVGCRFDVLEEGQQVEYVLDAGADDRARSVVPLRCKPV